MDKLSESRVNNFNPIRNLAINLTGSTTGYGIVDLNSDKENYFGNGNSKTLEIETYYSGTPSDERIKSNLEPIENATLKISALTGYTFDRIDIETPRQTGLIAQDVQKVLPEAVSENNEGYLSIFYGNLAGIFVEAIKEQDNKIKELEHKLNTLVDKLEE